VPDLPIGLHVYRPLALTQIHLVAAEEDHVLVPGRDVDAPAVAVVRSPYARAGAAVTVEQAIYIDAGDLAAAAGALEGRIRIVEHTLECVGDVDAGAGGAVERTCEIAALIRDALGLLRVLLIDAVARFVCRVRTVRQQNRGSVSAEIHVDLHARTGGLRQAPLAAAAPLAIVGVHRPYRRAHRRHFADARLKRPSARHINRDR